MELYNWTGIIIGFLVSLILIFYPGSKNNGNLILGFSFFCLTHALLTSELYRSQLMLEFPHFSRTGNFSAYLIAPLFFLFVKKIIYREENEGSWKWLILIPSFGYAVDYLPYFSLSASEKVEIIRSQQLNYDHFLFREGIFFPDEFHFFFRQIWLLVFMVLVIKLLWKNKNQLNREESNLNRYIFNFLVFITAAFCLAILPGFFRFIDRWAGFTVEIQTMTVSSALIGAGVFLVFNPRLLYGFYWSGSIKEKIEIKEIEPIKSASHIQTEELEELCDQVTNFVQSQKLYLKQGITINDLSKELNIPVYKISPAINMCYDTNFNQWINQFRIEEFDRLIQQGEHERLTLDGIASKCGFSNRTTFISAFKKIKGDTPSHYLKNISLT